MSSVRWPGQLWYSTCMICTAVSVLPVPGGPTTIVKPGCTPALIASTCAVPGHVLGCIGAFWVAAVGA